jgi:hypothetical protein
MSRVLDDDDRDDTLERMMHEPPPTTPDPAERNDAEQMDRDDDRQSER